MAFTNPEGILKRQATPGLTLHHSFQPSQTAESAAAGRAAHMLYGTPVIFRDPYAIDLTSPLWRLICKNKILAWLVFNGYMGIMRPIGAHILARSRYAEDQLEQAIKNGLTQYVILGAGMDSFALRRPDLADCVRVYEIDLPASQAVKLNRLAALKKPLPGNVEFIASDSEDETVMKALSRSSFSFDRPAFFSWLGATYYLTREAVLRSLQAMTDNAAGSEIVFDYGIPRQLHRIRDRFFWGTIEKSAARCGEPIMTSFLPEQMAAIIHDLGFLIKEQLSPEDQYNRYFRQSDRSHLPIASYFLHAQWQGGV